MPIIVPQALVFSRICTIAKVSNSQYSNKALRVSFLYLLHVQIVGYRMRCLHRIRLRWSTHHIAFRGQGLVIRILSSRTGSFRVSDKFFLKGVIKSIILDWMTSTWFFNPGKSSFTWVRIVFSNGLLYTNMLPLLPITLIRLSENALPLDWPS